MAKKKKSKKPQQKNSTTSTRSNVVIEYLTRTSRKSQISNNKSQIKKTRTANHNKQKTAGIKELLSLFDAEPSASGIGHWILFVIWLF